MFGLLGQCVFCGFTNAAHARTDVAVEKKVSEKTDERTSTERTAAHLNAGERSLRIFAAGLYFRVGMRNGRKEAQKAQKESPDFPPFFSLLCLLRPKWVSAPMREGRSFRGRMIRQSRERSTASVLGRAVFE
jgi:hypothetical protein